MFYFLNKHESRYSSVLRKISSLLNSKRSKHEGWLSPKLEFVDYKTAFDSSQHTIAHWDKVGDRLVNECWPEIKPSFTLDRGASIFTIGSCFAREIEEQLIRLGFRVPVNDFSAPASEWHGGTIRGIMNKYTPPSIFQEIAWAATIFERDGEVTEQDCAPFAYEVGEDQYIDNNLNGASAVTYARFLERRRQLYEIVAKVFTADCVVITPGLTEAWFDEERSFFIQRLPIGKGSVKSIRERLKFCFLDYETCYKSLQDTVDIIRTFNPNSKFLITTSPVPLSRTFTAYDVIIANTYAKSILRAACGELCRNNDGADYFPSYESVMLTRNWDVFQHDLIHIRPEFVAKIVAALAKNYFPDTGEAEKAYQASFGHARDSLTSAIEMAHLAAQLEPLRKEYRIHLGRLLYRANQPAEAAVELAEYVALDPSSYEGHRALAAALELNGDLNGAMENFLVAATLHPDDAVALSHVGRLQVRLGLWDQAISTLQNALAIDSTLAVAYSFLGAAYKAQNRRDDAVTVLTKAIEFDAINPNYHAQLGLVYRGAKMVQESLTCLRKAAMLAPNNKQFQQLLLQSEAESQL